MQRETRQSAVEKSAAEFENPYDSPTAEIDASDRESQSCSFCGRNWKASGPLVEAPDERAYICRQCAEIVLSTIEKNHPHAKRNLVLGSALFLAVLAFCGWLLWQAFSSEAISHAIFASIALVALIIWALDRLWSLFFPLLRRR